MFHYQSVCSFTILSKICNNLFFGPIEMESDNIMYKKKVVEDFSFLAGDFQGLCYFSGEYTPLLSCFES